MSRLQGFGALFTLAALIWVIAPTPGATQSTELPAVKALHAKVAAGCENQANETRSVETRVVCDRLLRVGLRGDYPRFAEIGPAGATGFEADVAREIAARLDVALEAVEVTPVNRISKLGEGEVDLVIATMGHNTQRDPTVHFLRPHYFQSETIVVGAGDQTPLAWEDLEARLVCTTVGNYSNVILAPDVGRLMLFSRSQQLIDALLNEMCPLIAQDDTLLLPLVSSETEPSRFERKLGFAPVPWGMAMPLGISDEMAAAMSEILKEMHRDGSFLRLARKYDVPVAFLTEEQERWQSAECRAAPESCLSPPLNVQLARSPVAGLGARFESALKARLGIEVRLGFMESDVAWRLFLGGLGTSMLAVSLALMATTLVGLSIGKMLVSPIWLLRALAKSVLTVFQNAPVMLVLVVMGTLTVWTFSYSYSSAMLAAILAIAGMNGSFAGAAVAEAYRITEAREGTSRFMRALSLSSAQVDSYLINAVRGISAASVVGVPDLVNALNGITAFSGSQTFYYWLLVLFYIVAVLFAAQLTRRGLSRILPSEGAVS
ncbi:ABC-type amino acid transport substrate-binding protein [Roseovarius litoreus]|uniref:ABC-type amino acid transport substrate-binding protein n=1 Tax=Roseovarius litoreus TaxID=1155722 RepID=A0A1M7EHT4_9RHOB|nr:transporter substrate-binding domain-containing protein [Roseovarius litoreus]SHL90889.1 ABC-type amino acid transport substrate-binding protein [Roseovarius litoreus]